MQVLERSDFMRLRNVKNAREILENSTYFVANPEEYKGHFSSLFSNFQPIHIEIGTGKGQFLIGMAKAYPEINFIGIEKYESVLVRAIQKVSFENLPNLKFFCYDAKELNQVFDHEIETLYLNFSDPWPKTRHAKRRLTSPDFLSVYDSFFCGNAEIIQKTDNTSLFSYSLESLSQHGYVFQKVSLDLVNEGIFNVLTEYEEKFQSLGFKINYVHAIKSEKE